MNSSYPYHLNGTDKDLDGISYEYSFEAKTIGIQLRADIDYKREMIGILFMDDEYEESISGRAGTDAIRVFSTVGRIVEDVYKKHPGYMIQFSASHKEPSRVRLYATLASRIAAKVDGLVTKVNKAFGVNYYIVPKSSR